MLLSQFTHFLYPAIMQLRLLVSCPPSERKDQITHFAREMSIYSASCCSAFQNLHTFQQLISWWHDLFPRSFAYTTPRSCTTALSAAQGVIYRTSAANEFGFCKKGYTQTLRSNFSRRLDREKAV